MRKIILLGALTAIASLSLGCALTDYPAIDPPVNKSHGVVDCTGSHDRIANMQQTGEPDYLDLFFRDPALGGSFGPMTLTGPVDKQTAKEWGRFVGPFAGIQGAGVRSTPCIDGVNCGQWEMGGVKDLSDGSTVITTFYSALPAAGFPPFSCGFGSTNNVGASHGGVVSQRLVPPANAGSVYMGVETVAIDSVAGQQWGLNVVATTPARAANGYSTQVGGTSRAGEYNLYATPITRRGEASLGGLIMGNTETIEIGGFQISAWGEMTDEGIVVHPTSIVAPNGATYTAGDNALSIAIGELGSRTYQVETTPAESLKLALFAREAGMGDQEFVMPEHVEGIPLPQITFNIGADAIDRKIDELTDLLSGDENGSFGG
jgi:hypothetical protein